MYKSFFIPILLGLNFAAFSMEKELKQEKAQTKKPSEPKSSTVSLIYFPNNGLGFSGIELEIDGKSLILSEGVHSYPTKSLKEMIEKAKKGGWPFVRVVFKVSAKQIDQINEIIKKKDCFSFIPTCSAHTVYVLSRAQVRTVPMPIEIFPTLTTMYLACAKYLDYDKNDIERIEYYGKSIIDDTKKIATGPCLDLCAIPISIFVLYLIVLFHNLMHELAVMCGDL